MIFEEAEWKLATWACETDLETTKSKGILHIFIYLMFQIPAFTHFLEKIRNKLLKIHQCKLI